MKKFIHITIVCSIIIILLALGVLLTPVLLICLPVILIQDYSNNKKQKDYLITLNGKNFFCYNNRTDAKVFIEKELLPKLGNNIELIYLNGWDVQSDYDKNILSKILYELRNYTGFPHLLKVREGKIIDASVNNEFYNTMHQNKPVDKLLLEIDSFFSSEKKKNIAS